MQVALYTQVSTSNQHQESTIASQVQVLQRHIHQQSWSLLSAHDYRDEGHPMILLHTTNRKVRRECCILCPLGRSELCSWILMARSITRRG
jgi:DNA invertase Pin-like site-specific DNA recombinase